MNAPAINVDIATVGDWVVSPTRGEMGGVADLASLAESDADAFAREALLDRAMGAARKRKSSEKLRRGRRPSEGLAFVVRDDAGRLVGTVRLWDVAVKRAISPLAGQMGGSPEGGAVPHFRPHLSSWVEGWG